MSLIHISFFFIYFLVYILTNALILANGLNICERDQLLTFTALLQRLLILDIYGQPVTSTAYLCFSVKLVKLIYFPLPQSHRIDDALRMRLYHVTWSL